jgi:hypothetical protein
MPLMEYSEETGERDQKPDKEAVRERSDKKTDLLETMIRAEYFRERAVIEYGMRTYDPVTGRPYEHNAFQETVETNILFHGCFYNHDKSRGVIGSFFLSNS